MRQQLLRDGDMIDNDSAGFNEGADQTAEDAAKEQWVERTKDAHVASRTTTTTTSLKHLANQLPPVARRPPFQFGQITTDRNPTPFVFESIVPAKESDGVAITGINDRALGTAGDVEMEFAAVLGISRDRQGKGREVETRCVESTSGAGITRELEGGREAVENVGVIGLQDLKRAVQRRLELIDELYDNPLAFTSMLPRGDDDEADAIDEAISAREIWENFE